MIELKGVSKEYATRSGVRTVLHDVNLTVRPGQKLGILGSNGAGKSTLVRLIGGAEKPTHGQIRRGMSVSWPLAFGGAFQGSLTGLDNLRFVCRVYGADPDEKAAYVQEFSELGEYFREPVRSYSAGMRARLAFAISMAVDFDCFLIDEVVVVGDSRFHEKCHEELFVKRADRAMVIVSHQIDYIRAHCSSAAILDHGRLTFFEDTESAIQAYLG
ncbi:MAG: ATP-binding cassette domain-containing protein [Pseudomonadota bacterium]